MATYEKKLKRSKDGQIVRYVGRNRKGGKEKFRLGYDLAEAEKRFAAIQALWSEIESKYTFNEEVVTVRQRAYWETAYLEVAKRISKGAVPTLPEGEYEDPVRYVERLTAISERSGIGFQPANPDVLATAISSVQADIRYARNTLSLVLDTPEATGQTLDEALDAYEAHVKKRSTDVAGSVAPWGKTKLDQLASIRAYLKDERYGGLDFLPLDLAELTYTRCEEIYGIFRCRPLTLRTNLKQRMTPASAQHFVKELNCFFDWLDGTEDFSWVEPRRFRKIPRTVDNLTAEEQYQRREARKKSTIPSEHLKTLFEYATPVERILLLMGLNCAFGAAEVGQLRIGFLKLDEAVIDGVRFKTGNETKHRLWPETIAGLRWVLEQRRHRKLLKPDYNDIVFISKRGKPVWHHTAKGNASNGVATIWNQLVKRVREDQDDNERIPAYSFNKLRKTAATRVLEIADAATASMILAHGTISDDELLEKYAQLPWKKLFAAQEQFRTELAAVLDIGNSDLWQKPRKNYIGLKKVKQIIALDQRGESARAIVQQVDVTISTVYRILQMKYGKRRSGRRPKNRPRDSG